VHSSEGLPSPIDSVVGNLFWGTAGVFTAVSVFYLWGGMWKYWIRLDLSSRAARRTWFLVLLIGVWYGGVLYYSFVYIPAIRKMRAKQFETPAP
jgi:hypothetical protein